MAIARSVEALGRCCACFVSCDDYARERLSGCCVSIQGSSERVSVSSERCEIFKRVRFVLLGQYKSVLGECFVLGREYKRFKRGCVSEK